MYLTMVFPSGINVTLHDTGITMPYSSCYRHMYMLNWFGTVILGDTKVISRKQNPRQVESIILHSKRGTHVLESK